MNVSALCRTSSDSLQDITDYRNLPLTMALLKTDSVSMNAASNHPNCDAALWILIVVNSCQAFKRHCILTLAGCLFIFAAFHSPTVEARRNQSQAARTVFAKENTCPSTGKNTLTCPGYSIGYIVPLCAGGADDISNMQWQATEDVKEKDKRERQLCKIETRE